MKTIRVSIDALVLRGFRPEDRHAVALGIQQELTRLLSEPGAAEKLMQLGNPNVLKAGRISLRPGEKPQQVGVRAAGNIGRSLAL